MITRFRLTATAATAAAIMVSALMSAGCGDGFGSRTKVSGTVNYKGSPVPKGTISFQPSDMNASGARAATGTIINGKYTLSTYGDNDGAVAGTYDIVIDSRDIDEEKTRPIEAGSAKQDVVAEANRKGKLLVPAKYGTASTTTLKGVKIPGGNYNFDLTD